MSIGIKNLHSFLKFFMPLKALLEGYKLAIPILVR
ncbi:hypothetical protein NEOC95_001468 [Neochlamydia sp. AcF95]|nr:hypothetical protein [Neochlamydia sp. AcF95]